MAGPIPMPPRYMFGIFFSRYWAYSDVESMGIVQQYQIYSTYLSLSLSFFFLS